MAIKLKEIVKWISQTSHESCLIINEIELELKDYTNQWRICEKEIITCVKGIKLKCINKASKGENLYAFDIGDLLTSTTILKETPGLSYNNGIESNAIIRLTSDTLVSTDLVKHMYYNVNRKFYKEINNHCKDLYLFYHF